MTISAHPLDMITTDPISNPSKFAYEFGLDLVLDATFGRYRMVEYRWGAFCAVAVGDLDAPVDPTFSDFRDLLWVLPEDADAHRQAAMEEISEYLNKPGATHAHSSHAQGSDATRI